MNLRNQLRDRTDPLYTQTVSYINTITPDQSTSDNVVKNLHRKRKELVEESDSFETQAIDDDDRRMDCSELS